MIAMYIMSGGYVPKNKNTEQNKTEQYHSFL